MVLSLTTFCAPWLSSYPRVALLQAELAGLQFDHLVELERDVIEGQGHTGRAAVVQLVARKGG